MKRNLYINLLELIFLTYINRSGSTYLAQILSGSDEILVCPEAEILVEKFLEAPEKKFVLTYLSRNKLIQSLFEDWKFKHWNIKQDELEFLSKASNNFEVFCSILSIYKANIKPGASKILFKAERIIYLWNRFEKITREENLLYLIIIIRDPRGIYASQKNTIWPGTKKPFSQNPVRTGILWRQYMKEVQRLTKLYSNIVRINYEDLLKNPAESLEYLSEKIQFKKIPFSPENGDLYHRIPEDHKFMHGNIESVPILEKENEWKQNLSKLDVDLIQSVTGKYMIKAGYTPEIRTNSLFIILRNIIPQAIAYYFSFYSKKILFWINKNIWLRFPLWNF